MSTSRWPCLRSYGPPDLGEIAMPIGGIGTGSISIAGNGALRDVEVQNRPAKGFTPANLFLAVWARCGDERVTRALEGPLSPPYSGSFGATAPTHRLPRFRYAAFHAAYPLAAVHLDDPDVPVAAVVEAFNPLVPGDADSSSLPYASLRVRLTNLRDQPTDASVSAHLPNLALRDLADHGLAPGHASFREGPGVHGVWFAPPDTDTDHEQWGSLALTTTSEDVTCRTAWPAGDDTLEGLWREFSRDGRLVDSPDAGPSPRASLAASVRLAPRQTRSVTFHYCWHFPNRMSWTPVEGVDSRIGNFYATRFSDAWDVAEHVAARADELEATTVRFVQAFLDADMPAAFKEATLFNLSTLNTQTCFRTPDGTLYGFEGCLDELGFCLGSSTHVWNFDQATPSLFGDLATSMRRVELEDATDADGCMRFRVFLPPKAPTDWPLAAADGQMGAVLKLHREWARSGDDALLRSLWPGVVRALRFAWVDGGWDADRDGVMEGAQHVTYDIKLYGPNPYTGLIYLAALRAVHEMATTVGDEELAATADALFERGRTWVDGHLFNGEHYVQQVRPVPPDEVIAAGLDHHPRTPQDPRDPSHQLRDGCLTDQLLGQLLAHVGGLGHVVDTAHVARTLESIHRLNRREGFHDHFNPGRSFAVGDESGLLVCSYPRERRATALMYADEVWAGSEYGLAALSLYEGFVDEAVRTVEDVRHRYDGRRRNPFNEVEAGHHYVRSLASWGLVLGWTGFRYDGRRGEFGLRPATEPRATWFWSNGYAWGTVTQARTATGVSVEIEVLFGELAVRRVRLEGQGAVDVPETILAHDADATLQVLVEG